MCLRGLRNFSDSLRERILALPKRKPVTGKYMAHMKTKAASPWLISEELEGLIIPLLSESERKRVLELKKLRK